MPRRLTIASGSGKTTASCRKGGLELTNLDKMDTDGDDGDDGDDDDDDDVDDDGDDE